MYSTLKEGHLNEQKIFHLFKSSTCAYRFTVNSFHYNSLSVNAEL